jgi:hypothetical protein
MYFFIDNCNKVSGNIFKAVFSIETSKFQDVYERILQ